MGGVGIANEIAETANAEQLAKALAADLSADERLKCKPTFSSAPGMTLNMFAMPNGRLQEILSILTRNGLIEDSEERTDGTLRSTSLGRRVFAVWDANGR